MEEEGGGQLFDGVSISIVPSDGIDEITADQLAVLVNSRGGSCVSWPAAGVKGNDLLEITHILASDADFPGYNDALENGVHVVKPSWVIHSTDRKKLANPRQYSPDPAQFFSNVVLTTGNLPEHDKDVIIGLVMALGGTYSGSLSKLVTHIATNDLNDRKCEETQARGLGGKIKMVLPHWFDDCFSLGRRINEKPYMFPDPEMLRDDRFKIRDPLAPALAGAMAATPTSMPDERSPPLTPTKARMNSNALMSRDIRLSDDLVLGDRMYKTLQDMITYAGGTITTDVAEADIYVGQYRDGNDYLSASRAKKEVANLAWLFHVLNRNRYTNPLSKLCHYPIPRQPIPGFEHMRISISNYTGEARIYLENLIRYCGATFTKTMKQDNTHLITAHTQSEKYEAAQQWNINVVNHIWLEESYAKCAVQIMTNPRYTRFPARTNLGEVVGQTSFDMARMEQVYFPKLQAPLPASVSSSHPTIRAKPSPRKTVPTAGPAKKVANVDLHEDDSGVVSVHLPPEDDAEATPAPATKRHRGRPRKSVDADEPQDDEKENDAPLLLGSGRASKIKALDQLHQAADDIAQFQKELKRKGGVTHGGRPSDHPEDFSSPIPVPKQRKKRTSDEATYDATADGSDLSDGETQQQAAKRAKKGESPTHTTVGRPMKYNMMVTGDDRWLNNASKESQDREKLRQLGITLTQDAKDVDILVAPKILRTRKFVCALACAPIVVDATYLDAALKKKTLIENPSLLSDRDAEQRLGFVLADALDRAKINQRKLLRGWSIFVTKDVAPGFDTYKEIINLNGGDAYLYQGRTGLTLPKRRLRDDPEAGSESQHQGGAEEFDYVYLVSGVSEAEMKLWKTFRDVARKQDMKARIVKNDWLLRAAMSQEVCWDSEWELTEEEVKSA